MNAATRRPPDGSTILSKLRDRYGPPERRISGDPLSGLIETILSQNTSDSNTERAFKSLRSRFPTWDDVVRAEVDEVADAIRTGGLAQQKAPRIQSALREIHARSDDYDLSFLSEMSSREAAEWMTSLHGVGPKTAACVLLFDLGRDVLPVDTHVHRVSGRLGLIDANTSAAVARTVLESKIPPDDRYDAHVLFIQLGRDVCKARKPRCRECALQCVCPSATAFISES